MGNLAWTSISGGGQSVQGTGATGDTFASGAADGLSLTGVGSFAVYAEADLGQTITVAVQAKAYVQDPVSLRWARAEALDVKSQTVTGVRSALIGVFATTGLSGRIAYENNGGTVSSGSLTFRLIPATTRP